MLCKMYHDIIYVINAALCDVEYKLLTNAFHGFLFHL